MNPLAARSILELNASTLAVKLLLLVLTPSVLIWRPLGRTNWRRISSENQAC